MRATVLPSGSSRLPDVLSGISGRCRTCGIAVLTPGLYLGSKILIFFGVFLLNVAPVVAWLIYAWRARAAHQVKKREQRRAVRKKCAAALAHKRQTQKLAIYGPEPDHFFW